MREFFSEEDRKRIASAIAQVESRTSSEIRMHIVRNDGKNPFSEGTDRLPSPPPPQDET